MQLLKRASAGMLCSLGLLVSHACADSSSKIKADLRAYVAALNSKHPATNAWRFVFAAKPGAQAWEKMWTMERDVASRRTSSSPKGIELRGVDNVVVTGNRAKATVKFYWSTVPRQENLQLRRVANTWQIVPGQDPNLALASVTPLEQSAYFLANSITALHMAKAKSEMRNLKNLTLNLYMRVETSENTLFSQKAIAAAQSKNARFPATLRVAGTGDSYTFNSTLEGKKMGQIAQPWNRILLYDGKARRLRPRYNGRGVVAFVDGHIELLTPQQLRSKTW